MTFLNKGLIAHFKYDRLYSINITWDGFFEYDVNMIDQISLCDLKALSDGIFLSFSIGLLIQMHL